MSFGVSLDDGKLEYGSAHPLALLAQPSNAFKPRFWSMMADLIRFYREAPAALAALELQPQTLGQLLDRGGYGRAFQEDHLLPQVGRHLVQLFGSGAGLSGGGPDPLL